LDVIATLIAQSGINPDDLATIRRLQEEFQAELATLRGRVDALEAETATLRAQQFSTTTKLRGQVDMHLVTPFDTLGDNANTSVANRARLNFDSSFTGNDRLRVRLQGGDGDAGGPFGLANAGGAAYDVQIDDFYYSFPVGNRITVTASARGLSGDDWVTSTIVPFDGPAVFDPSGPLFYDFGGSTSNGAGVGINFALTDNIILDAGYTAANSAIVNGTNVLQATSPSVGIFAAQGQSYIAQLNFLTDGFFNAAATYLHSDGVATVPSGGALGSTDSYAGLLSLDFGGFFLAGHGAYTTFNGGDTFSWTVGAGFNNFLAEGTQLGVYAGEGPSAGDNQPFFVEGYYEIPFNQYLTITPSVLYGDTRAPGGGDTTGLWGALRATFRF